MIHEILDHSVKFLKCCQRLLKKVGELIETKTLFKKINMEASASLGVPDSLVVRRESGQTAYYVSCKRSLPRNPWRVNWFIYRSDALWLPTEG